MQLVVVWIVLKVATALVANQAPVFNAPLENPLQQGQVAVRMTVFFL